MLSKLLKVILSTFILFTSSVMLTPKKQENTVHAVLPAVVWLLEVLVAEIAFELGWKFVGKPAFKKIQDKVVKQIADNFDFFDMGKKLITKKDGKLKVDVSPLDRQKIAKLLKDEAEDIIEKDDENRTKNSKPRYDLDYPEGDPLDNTSVEVFLIPSSVHADSTKYDPSQMGVDFITKMYHWIFTPIAYEKESKIELKSIVDGSVLLLGEFDGNESTSPEQYSFYITQYDIEPRNNSFQYQIKIGTSNTSYVPDGQTYSNKFFGQVSSPTRQAFDAYLKQLELSNRVIYMADGVIVPKDNTQIYNVPINAPSDTVVPNTNVLDIDLEIPISNDDGTEVTYNWDSPDLVKYEIDIDNRETTIINEGDTTITNNYYSTTNYYYTDHNYEDKVDDIVIVVPPCSTCGDDDDDDDDGGAGDLTPKDDPIDVPKSFFYKMYEMSQKVIDMYEGLNEFMEKSIEGFKKLGDGTSGLVAFLDEFFDWLPSEYRYMYTGAFMLGVVGFFLRR